MLGTRGHGRSLNTRLSGISIAVVLLMVNGAAWAQSEPAQPAPADAPATPVAASASPGEPNLRNETIGDQSGVQVQDRVVVTGSRKATKASQSLTPIDVITGAELQQTGKSSLRDALQALSPSISHAAYAGDQGLLTNAFTLHGSTPDQVLVLVNGKRRHGTANITQDAGPQAGSTGVDVDLIPVDLIDHVEILRDAAAAQYGSDAIAGVINIILKSSTSGGSISDTVGQTYQGDGLSNNFSISKGFSLGNGGFLDLSAEYDHQNHTERTNAYDNYFGFLPGGVGAYNPIEGDPEVTRELVGFNAGYYLNDDTQVYGFGSYGHRSAAAYQNIRSPIIINEIYDLPGLLSTYPNGYVPTETVNENDYSITAGVKGSDLFGWKWDLSSTYGGDSDSLGVTNDANLALFAETGSTPTGFNLGTLSNTQWTNNFDVSHEFHFLLPEPVTVSAGIEQRRETYTIGAGEPASWGADAITGFLPSSAGSFSRDVLGAYLDLAGKFTPNWRFDVSGRYDHYSDAGGTTNGKFATRYDFSPGLALRGSISTGFRAPTLAEEYLTNLTVSPTSASGLLAANSAAARTLGAQNLKPEQSTNFNIGLVLHPTQNLNVTVDAYQIDIRNRIVLGGTAAGASALNALDVAGITVPEQLLAAAQSDPGLVTANYFTNGASTRTDGIDLTATYHSNFGDYGAVDWDLAANINNTSVTKIGINHGVAELNQQQTAWLTSAAPKNKIIVGGNWRLGKWGVSLHETRYGSTSDYQTYITGPYAFSTTHFQYFRNSAKYTTDLEVRYNVTKTFQIAAGADNLFNAKPSTLPEDAWFSGSQYDAYGAQISPSGGFYYLRAKYLF
jgi:iron complex outermembrane recepter protein